MKLSKNREILVGSRNRRTPAWLFVFLLWKKKAALLTPLAAYFLHRSARLRDTSRVTRFIFIAVCLFLESFGSPRSTELPRDSEATITLRVPLIPGPSMSRDALGQTATSTDFGNSVANSYVDDTLCLACEVFFLQAELFWNKYYATLINMLALIPHYFDQNKFDTNHFIFLWKLCNVNLRVM